MKECYDYFLNVTEGSCKIIFQKEYQLLEEVAHTLLVAPVLDPGQQSVVKVLVDLVKLWDLEEDGLDLLDAQHWL